MKTILKKLKKLRKKAVLYKVAFRAKECSCIFNIKEFINKETVHIKMTKTCEEHGSLKDSKDLTLRVYALEKGIDDGEFIIDTLEYMKNTKEQE